MTPIEYRAQLELAWTLATIADGVPAAAMLELIATAEAVGPIRDPTLYRDKMTALEQDRDLLAAVRQFQAAIAAIRRKALGHGAA